MSLHEDHSTGGDHTLQHVNRKNTGQEERVVGVSDWDNKEGLAYNG